MCTGTPNGHLAQGFRYHPMYVNNSCMNTHNIMHYRQVVRPKPVDATNEFNFTEIKFYHHRSPLKAATQHQSYASML